MKSENNTNKQQLQQQQKMSDSAKIHVYFDSFSFASIRCWLERSLLLIVWTLLVFRVIDEWNEVNNTYLFIAHAVVVVYEINKFPEWRNYDDGKLYPFIREARLYYSLSMLCLLVDCYTLARQIAHNRNGHKSADDIEKLIFVIVFFVISLLRIYDLLLKTRMKFLVSNEHLLTLAHYRTNTSRFTKTVTS
jgi:hypothetical protein